MAIKQKSWFNCQQCGYQSPKWLGKCPDCGAWNSLVEEHGAKDGPGERPRLPGGKPVAIGAVAANEESRRLTGIAEFDRVLGGGVVAGSLVLIGGDPGIGKSTLLLQVMNRLAQAGAPILVLDRIVHDLDGHAVEWRLGMGHFADKYYLAEMS